MKEPRRILRAALIAGSFSFLIGLCAPLNAEEITLARAYQLALGQNEKLALTKEEIKIARARYYKAVSAILPRVHFISSEIFLDDGNSSSSDLFCVDSECSSNRSDIFQTQFSVVQPLFTGFRNLLLIDAAQAEISASEHLSTRRKEVLFDEVSKSFYQSILYQRDLEQLKSTERVIRGRIKELKDFVALGKSREAELLAAQAELSELRVSQEQTKGLLQATLELVSFLTGLPSAALTLKDTAGLPIPGEMHRYLQTGTNRADILAAEAKNESAQHQLVAARRESWPTLSLEGNTYPIASPDMSGDWDVLLRLDVPIFEGGRIDANIDEKMAQLRSSELLTQEARRTAQTEIRTAFNDLNASLSEVSRLKELVTVSRKNYESQRNDYNVGIVTNLDVLSAIRQMQNANRRLITAEIDAKLDHGRLLVAAGEVPQ